MLPANCFFQVLADDVPEGESKLSCIRMRHLSY